MTYVTVPKDLTKIKSKVLSGPTERQLVYFSPTVLMGALLFFLFKGNVGTSATSFCMISVILPLFLLGMYEWNGESLEVVAKHFIHTEFLLPKEHPYQTNNFYVVLMWRNRLEKEVKAIVKNKKDHLAARTDPYAKAGN